VNPISIVTGVITHPRRTVENVAGATYGVAATGARTAMRVLGWAMEPSAGGTPEPSSAAVEPVTPPVPATPVPQGSLDTAPAKKSPAKKAPAKKAPAKKAASKKAAVVAPALGLTEAEVMEAEMTQRASDPDKG
jgi:hypothetical protein